ncbi:MAG TPA: hypothetical protein VHP60_06250 [Thermoanaerobaculia bacterium]|nr:hypothetical protein [Thermoanaerobaculia bacterium]
MLALAWLALLHIWAAFAVHVLPLARPSPWGRSAIPYFARFDSGWYYSIARDGYGPPPLSGIESAHAFFPLYPMLARSVVLLTGLDPLWVLAGVSWIAFVFALPLFGEECRARLGPERARGPLPFLLLYPVAFFFAAAYTESLFFLLLLLAFRLIRTERPLAAIFVGLLLGLTRAPAAAVGPALALAYVLRPDWTKRLPRAAVLAVAPLAGVLAYVLGIGWWKGEPGLFFRAMGAWAHRSTSPVGGAASFLKEQVALFSEGTLFRHPGAIAPLAHFTLFAVLAVVQVHRRRYSDAAWTAGVLGLAFLTGTTNGVPRYTATIFSGHILLFELLEHRPALRTAALALSTALLLLRAALFVNWHFVS